MKKRVYYFLNKWFKSRQRNKKSSIYFCLFLTIAICMCALADKPANKMASNIEYVYKVNMCMATTHGKDLDAYEKLCEAEGVEEVVLEYRDCLPMPEINNESGIGELSGNYETFVYVLPYSSKAFKLTDCVKYGTYYTDANQIILTAEMADRLMPQSPERLIGQTIKRTLYGVGEVTFEIVGIFDYFNDFEKEYFNAMEVYISTGDKYNPENYEDMYFINGEFTKQYLDDENFYMGDQRGYTLYFDSYSDMKTFYKNSAEQFDTQEYQFIDGRHSGTMAGLFYTMYKLFLPLSFFIAFFTIMFYVSIVRTELVYNSGFISVFEYAGYSKKKVLNCFIMLHIRHLLVLCAVASVTAYVITALVNYVNQKAIFVNFRIFTYNPVILSAYIAFIVLTVIISINIQLHRLKITSWYENVIRQRDLI